MTADELRELKRELVANAEAYGREITPAAVRIMAHDLSEFDFKSVGRALAACRKELTRFPTIADIISRIQAKDGRPGVEEAWSMIPKDEYGSATWTVEMATAYAAAHPHVRVRDFVAARMAFKEVYEREVKAAREVGVPATWSATLGEDPAGRETALAEAVRKNQLTLDQARKVSHLVDGADSISNQMKSLVARISPDLAGGSR